jgi:hypothetical protein
VAIFSSDLTRAFLLFFSRASSLLLDLVIKSIFLMENVDQGWLVELGIWTVFFCGSHKARDFGTIRDTAQHDKF